MSAYPDDLPTAALCVVDGGCIWHGGAVCVRCRKRLRCGLCGQMVREDKLNAHLDEHHAVMHGGPVPDDPRNCAGCAAEGAS